ncbi:MAG: zinc ribbon domain-containing protein [Acidobacteriaceae bacterium]
MPLYEYRCKQCGHQFEKIQSFSAPEEKVCPVCGGEVEKLISAPAFQFKGSGWYVNDYAAKGNAKAASGPKEGSSDSKPAAAESKAAYSSETSSKPAASTSTKSE